MEDERDFFTQEIAFGRDMIGRDPEPAELAREFAKLGLEQRALKLKQLDASLERKGSLSINEAAREFRYARALRNMHEDLRKVGR